MPNKTLNTQTVAVISDIHFDLHDKKAWKAWMKWVKDVQPDKIVILGDFLDLGMMSRYKQGRKDPINAIPQVKCFVKEANKLAEYCGKLIVVEGNHDDRWENYISGEKPHVLKGAKGLSLEDQCYFHGLTKDLEWIREDTVVRGVECGPFLLRHGHRQGGRFGGGKHVAANRLASSMGRSEVFGHFHRAQIHCHTAQGRTAVAVANPALTGPHDYNCDPNWQQGFTILELYGEGHMKGSPYIVIMDDHEFSYHGKVYSGKG